MGEPQDKVKLPTDVARNRLTPDITQSFHRDAYDFKLPTRDVGGASELLVSLSEAEQSYRRANGLIEQWRQISHLPKDSEIEVQDRNGQTIKLRVSDLCSQLQAGIKSSFEDALGSINGINPIEAMKVDRKAEESLFRLEHKKSQNPSADIRDVQLSDTLKDAPTSIRLSYSQYLANDAIARTAENGSANEETTRQLKAAQLIMQPVHDVQNQSLKTACQQLSKTLGDAQSDRITAVLPVILAQNALEKARAGNFSEAIADVDVAIRRADAAGNQKGPDGAQSGLADLTDLPIALRLQQLNLLVDSKQWTGADKLIVEIESKSASIKKDEQFRGLREAVELRGGIVNPFTDLHDLTAAFEKRDMQAADKALVAFEKSAAAVNRDDRQTKKISELHELLKDEKNPAVIANLNQELQLRTALQQSPLTAEYLHGRLALAAGNYAGAKALFADISEHHPEFAANPKLQFADLIKQCDESQVKKGFWHQTLDVLKEVTCDITAIGAGAGAVVLTGLTGPGAVFAGAGAGAVAYTGAKACLFGTDSITWATPAWGALDGVSGGSSALVRQALTKSAAGFIEREVVEQAVLKAGGTTASLAGLEGFELSNAATRAAKAGLGDMAKSVPWSVRMRAGVGLAGESEYTVALQSYRQLRNTNAALNFGREFLSVGSASSIYNTGLGASDYYYGRERNLSTLVGTAGLRTLGDAFTGGLVGPAAARGAGRLSSNCFDPAARQVLPNLTESILGAVSSRSASAIMNADESIDAWIDYRRTLRRPANDELFNRFHLQLKDVAGPSDVILGR